jgi:regulator of protease activity HflC (stomatin/prohibitin superfamily)
MTGRIKFILRRAKIGSIFALLISVFILIVCWNRIVIVIPAGSKGIVWYIFAGGSTEPNSLLNEGVHLVFPWNRVFIYDLRLQEHHDNYEALTRDGLAVGVVISYRWKINSHYLNVLNQEFGPQYVTTLIKPQIGISTREVIARYTVDELISPKRNEIRSNIFAQVANSKLKNGISDRDTAAIYLTDVGIMEVSLPKIIKRSIELKLSQAQIVEEYQFRIKREALESKRKAEEARGISDFQKIVRLNLSNNYLRWRGIEATLELARSPNSKTVVIGNQHSGGLPLILDSSGKSDDFAKSTSEVQAKVSDRSRSVPQ